MGDAAWRSRSSSRSIHLVAADLLIDQRLLSWLTAQTTDVILSPRIGDRPETAAFLRAKSLDAPNLEAAHVNVVEVALSADVLGGHAR